jgi:hypothetical protein
MLHEIFKNYPIKKFIRMCHSYMKNEQEEAEKDENEEAEKEEN